MTDHHNFTGLHSVGVTMTPKILVEIQTYNFRLKSLLGLGLFCIFSTSCMKAVGLKDRIVDRIWQGTLFLGVTMCAIPIIRWYF